MKIVAFIPYWLDYQVDELGEHKNLKKLGGRYLLNYSIELLNSIPSINETIVYCSNNKINNYIDSNLDYTFLKRDDKLDNNDISIDEVIESFLNQIDADIVILLHPNSPFISSDTLNECISNILSKQYDSAFTAYKFKKLTWFKNKPLNYTLKNTTPQLKDLDPIIIEQSSLYVFTKESFKIHSKRIGSKPFIKNINHFEGLEVESEEEFEIAELIVNSGMYSKVS
jgi:CMP-N-acetylneuraminic acid synthetase